jgi:hypothetical protein
MGELIIKTGDSLTITITIPIPPTFVPALAPVSLVGSGTDVLVQGSPVCLPGDVKLPATLAEPLYYTAGPYSIQGTGTLTLGSPNVTALTLSGGSPIVINGQFSATFTVVTPATMATPDGPVLDPVPGYGGSAVFSTTNDTVTAS